MDPFTEKVCSYGLYIEYVSEYDRYNDSVEKILEQMKPEENPIFLLDRLFDYHITLRVKDPRQFKKKFNLPENDSRYSNFTLSLINIEMYEENEGMTIEKGYDDQEIAQRILAYSKKNSGEFVNEFKKYRLKALFDPEKSLREEVGKYENQIKELEQDPKIEPYKKQLYVDLLATIADTKAYYRTHARSGES